MAFRRNKVPSICKASQNVKWIVQKASISSLIALFLSLLINIFAGAFIGLRISLRVVKLQSQLKKRYKPSSLSRVS